MLESRQKKPGSYEGGCYSGGIPKTSRLVVGPVNVVFCTLSSPACRSLKQAMAHTSSQAEMKLTTFDIFNEQQSKKCYYTIFFHYFNNEE